MFVTTDATGNASFSGTIGTPVGIGQAITMTATDPEGNTSEFSAPVVVTTTSGDQVVTNTLDSGPGSLRQAILNVNAKTGGGKVVFGIPGSGPHTIRPISPLPLVTKTVRIDGYTQPGSSVNTLPFANGTNAVLKIEIDGTNLGSEGTTASVFAEAIALCGDLSSTVLGTCRSVCRPKEATALKGVFSEQTWPA